MAIFSKKYENEIILCRPVEWHDLILYPVTIGQRTVWDSLKEILLVMQQNLPVKLASMSYLNMLCALGLGDELRQLICLVLRLYSDDSESVLDVSCVQFLGFDETVTALSIRQGSSHVRVSDAEFPVLRSLIAEQNLLKLPDESHNAELVEAERDTAEFYADNDLIYDFESELYFISQHCGISLSDVLGLSIREFYKRMGSAINRIRNDQCAVAESMGCKFKFGNPFPHPVYARKERPMHIQSESEMNARNISAGASPPDFLTDTV